MKRTWTVIAIVVAAACLPLALIALGRSRPSPNRPIHLVFDMDQQPKFKPQRANPMFADGRAVRLPRPGTVAREDLLVPNVVLNDAAGLRMLGDRAAPRPLADAAEHDRILLGVQRQEGGKMDFVTQMPVPVTLDLLRRGQERFNIYCAACHGLGGYGDGLTARRAAELGKAGELQADLAEAVAGWVAPSSLHTTEIRGRSVGHLYNTITNGIRTMPAYGSQVPVTDRWAIVAYVKALQRSQNARLEDVPAEARPQLQSAN